jgi:hypothetical protein
MNNYYIYTVTNRTMSIVTETVEQPEARTATLEDKNKTTGNVMSIRSLKSFMAKESHDDAELAENVPKILSENLPTGKSKDIGNTMMSFGGIKSLLTRGESELKPNETANAKETISNEIEVSDEKIEEKSSFSAALSITGMKSFLMRSHNFSTQENEVSKDLLEGKTDEKVSSFPTVLSVTSLKSFLTRAHEEETIDDKHIHDSIENTEDKILEKSSIFSSSISATNIKAFLLRSHDDHSPKIMETEDNDKNKEKKSEERSSTFSANLSAGGIMSFMTRNPDENVSKENAEPSVAAKVDKEDINEPTTSDSEPIGKI